MAKRSKTLSQLLQEMPNSACRTAAQSLHDWAASVGPEVSIEWPPAEKDGGYAVRVAIGGASASLTLFQVVSVIRSNGISGWLLIHWKANKWGTKVDAPLATRLKRKIDGSHIAIKETAKGWSARLEQFADAKRFESFIRAVEEGLATIETATTAPLSGRTRHEDEPESNAQEAALSIMVDLVSSESRRPIDFDPANLEDGRTRIVQEIVRRQGQGAFRQAVLKAYQGRCAISGCELEHVLEAAHIRPYWGQQTNHVQNGLLLRSDLHTLFDLHLLTISPSDWKVRISGSIAANEYRQFHGKPISVPKNPACRPHHVVLREHLSKLRP